MARQYGQGLTSEQWLRDGPCRIFVRLHFTLHFMALRLHLLLMFLFLVLHLFLIRLHIALHRIFLSLHLVLHITHLALYGIISQKQRARSKQAQCG